MNYVLFLLVSYSIAFIVTEQKIFEEIRTKLTSCISENPNFFQKKLCQLFHCPSCVGFWAGSIITLMGLNVFNTGFFDFFFGGLLSSLFCYFFHLFKAVIEKVIKDKWDIEL